MPCDGSGLASVERNTLPATRLNAAPRVSSRPSPLSMNSLRWTLLWIVVVAVEPPLPSSPVSITPAPPRLATMRLSSTVLPLARWISTPMQKLRISRPAISTPWVSTAARPGLVVVRTLAPYWPGAAPSQVRWPLSAMKPDPSSATNVPARRHGMPSMRTGPLIAGSSEAGLMTCGPGPSGSISMRKRPGAALLRSIAQRSEPSPSSAVRVTRSVSICGAVCASACGRPMSSVTQAMRSSVCNCSSRIFRERAPIARVRQP